jgi:DNA-directed RNA polymerase specialized sigma24 family protein
VKLRIVIERIARGVPAASAVGIAKFVKWLKRSLAPWKEQLVRMPRRRVQKFIRREARKVADHIKTTVYDPAVIRADLPPDVSGEVYERAWKKIGRYDPTKGTLVTFIRSFIRRIRWEEKRKNNPFGRHVTKKVISIHHFEKPIEIPDPAQIDPAASPPCSSFNTFSADAPAFPLLVLPDFDDEEMRKAFEAIVSHYVSPQQAVEEVILRLRRLQDLGELRLIDIWKEAYRSCLLEETPENRAIIYAIYSSVRPREEIAADYPHRFKGQKPRDGIDRVGSRYVEKVRNRCRELLNRFNN